MKSLRLRDEPAEPAGLVRNDSRQHNDAPGSPADREVPLFRMGPGKKRGLSWLGHLLMENRARLVVGAGDPRHRRGRSRRVACADRDAGLVAVSGAVGNPARRQNTAGEPRASIGALCAVPAVARASGRKQIEEAFAWVKMIALQGQDEVPWHQTGRLDRHARR